MSEKIRFNCSHILTCKSLFDNIKVDDSRKNYYDFIVNGCILNCSISFTVNRRLILSRFIVLVGLIDPNNQSGIKTDIYSKLLLFHNIS